MTFEERSAYRAIAAHLDGVGLRPSVRDDGLHLGTRNVVLRLQTDPDHPPVDDVATMLVWLDVFGLDDRPMRFDLAGWGNSTIERVAELGHGIADSIVPSLRWLADDLPATVDTVPLDGANDWDVYVGSPWVVVASDEGESVDALADDIRRSLGASRAETVRRLKPLLLPLTESARPHWVKLYMASYPSGPDGRIDVDSTDFWSGVELAESFTWPSSTAIQIVRQLIAMKPRPAEKARQAGANEGLGSKLRRRFLGGAPD